MAKTTRQSDQFMLRLPDGLRNRIKEYAENHGRSMNAEIVRVLEREYPEPWPLETRLEQLLNLADVLKRSINNQKVDELGLAILDTLKGIATGQIDGADDTTRVGLAEWLAEWEKSLEDIHREEYEQTLDEEEQENYDLSGRTVKVVHVDPKKKMD